MDKLPFLVVFPSLKINPEHGLEKNGNCPYFSVDNTINPWQYYI